MPLILKLVDTNSNTKVLWKTVFYYEWKLIQQVLVGEGCAEIAKSYLKLSADSVQRPSTVISEFFVKLGLLHGATLMLLHSFAHLEAMWQRKSFAGMREE